MISIRQAASSAFAVLQLLRPLNFVLSAMGVAVGSILGAGSIAEAFSAGRAAPVILAMLSAAFIGSAANAVNDAVDVPVDRINRPNRPIPSGRTSIRVARITALVSALVGFALSIPISPAHIVFAASFVFAVFAYSFWIKRMGFAGNLLVSLIVGSTLLYGALASGRVGNVWVGFVAAFLLTFAREVVKDIEDVDGDRIGDIRSLPLVAGHRAARLTAGIAAGVTVILSPMPYLHLQFSGLYLFAVTVACLFLVASVWILMGESQKRDRASQASLLLKAAMAVGMIALALS